MNVDVFILARLGSARVPQKHLRKICGVPAIKILVERLQSAKKIRNIVVCTTNLRSDDPLVDFLIKENIMYFRGDEKDIISRLLAASKKYETDIIVDVEGDKIYTDPEFVDKVIDGIQADNIDFVIGSDHTKKFDPTDHFIHGLIPAAIKTTTLEKIFQLKKTEETETGYKEMFFHTDLFKVKFIALDKNITYSKKIRLALDYQEDLDLADIIFNELGMNFHLMDIVRLFNNKPELTEITEPIRKKWEENYRKNLVHISFYSNNKTE
ncbi:acylneuraminate cytidylyltransferase [Candidatus Parcubacteria bacterium]|nr:MAG: acylneuraminate cytidylyltransferase [Candidatus Parcubacteria bacterium]